MNAREQQRLMVLNRVLTRELTGDAGATLMGISLRQLRRLLAAYQEDGAAALAHGNRGRLPAHALPADVKTCVVAAAQTTYAGCNYAHLTELLAEREGLVLSRSSVWRVLTAAGLKSPRKRRAPQHRCRRQRMPQEGMLLQMDGSHHAWLGDRGPRLALLLAIDDATGTVPYALFRDQEDTHGYLLLVQGIITRRGIPLAVYTDRHAVFQHQAAPQEAGGVGAGEPTQFGRALMELGITEVFAHSPEAKGRVERANGTFQDRLVAEMCLAGVSTMAEANGILEEFLPRFNGRFGVPAAQPEVAYRPLGAGLDLEGVLCFKERRRVAKDNTVQYRGRTLQLFPGIDRPSYARARVEVQERLDGRVLVSFRGKILTPEDAPPLAAALRASAEACTGLTPRPPWPYGEDPEPAEPASGETRPKVIWYEDSAMMSRHRDLVKAGMERARQQGKRIGRPRVTERSEFLQRFGEIAGRIGPGGLSRRRAAKELGIGYATLKRILDAQAQLTDRKDTLPAPGPSQQSTPNGIRDERSATGLNKDPGDRFIETAA